MFSGRFFLLSPCQPRDFPAGNISRYNPACPQPVIPRHASRPENDKTSRPDTPVSYSRPPVVFSRVDPSHPVRTMPANPHNGHPTITQDTVIRLHTVSACVSTISPPSPCIFASPHSITNIPVPVPETDDPPATARSSADIAPVSETIRQHTGTAQPAMFPRIAPFRPAQRRHARPRCHFPACRTVRPPSRTKPGATRFLSGTVLLPVRHGERASSFRMRTLHAHRPNG